MSLSDTIKLRYRGRLASPDLVETLSQEVEDICRIQGWTYQLWQEDWQQPSELEATFEANQLNVNGHASLRGISFCPKPADELVWLTFQADGVLQSLITRLNPTFTGDEVDMPWQRIKTSIGRPESHLTVCRLLRYLGGRYFSAFEVLDESGFWKYQDEDRFHNWSRDMTAHITQLQADLAAIEADETLDPETRHRRSMAVMKAASAHFRVAES